MRGLFAWPPEDTKSRRFAPSESLSRPSRVGGRVGDLLQLAHAERGEAEKDGGGQPVPRRAQAVPRREGGVEGHGRALPGEHRRQPERLPPDGAHDAAEEVGQGGGEESEQLEVARDGVLEEGQDHALAARTGRRAAPVAKCCRCEGRAVLCG